MRSRLLVVGTLAGAIVLFAWQSVSNGVLRLPEKGLRNFANDSTSVAAHSIRALAPQNGMYFSGYGAFAAIDISADYADKRPQFVSMMLKQFVVNLAVVFALMLMIDRLGSESVVRTGVTYSVLALAYMGMVDVSNAIWWNFSTPWTLGNMIDQVIAFFLVGVTLAVLRNRLGEPHIETAERAGVHAQGGMASSDAGARAPR
jgi:hypothetical protein